MDVVRGFDKNLGATVVEFLQNYSEFDFTDNSRKSNLSSFIAATSVGWYWNICYYFKVFNRSKYLEVHKYIQKVGQLAALIKLTIHFSHLLPDNLRKFRCIISISLGQTSISLSKHPICVFLFVVEVEVYCF